MKTLVLVGFGPGTATAVAEKFGSEGFSLALIGRNEGRLAAGVAALKGRGIDAFAFPADAATNRRFGRRFARCDRAWGRSPRCSGPPTARWTRAIC